MPPTSCSVERKTRRKEREGVLVHPLSLHDEPFIRTKAATSVDVLGGGRYRILRLLLVVQ